MLRTAICFVQQYASYSSMLRTAVCSHSSMLRTAVCFVQQYASHSSMLHTAVCFIQQYGSHSSMLHTAVCFIQQYGSHSSMLHTATNASGMTNSHISKFAYRGLQVRSPGWASMPVLCNPCVLSHRSRCVGLITRPDLSYRMRCV